MRDFTLACLCICCLLTGCGGYEGLSPEAYQYAKALYSICNRHDDAKLSRLEDQVTTAQEAQRISVREAAWLNEIVATAQGGHWPDAMDEARRMMEDQIHVP